MPTTSEAIGEDAKAKKQLLLQPSTIQAVQEGGSEEAGSDPSAPHSSDESDADDCKIHDGTLAWHCAYTGLSLLLKLCLYGEWSLAMILQVT